MTAPPRVSAWTVLLSQLTSVVVLLLAAAMLAALASGDPLDAAAIAAVLVLNTAIGFIIELRAARAVAALLQLEAPRAVVVREGAPEEVDARRLVPGDVVELEGGRVVPADGRLLGATELRTVEATLTGESLPVEKAAGPVLPPDTPLAERANMVYAGTEVATGRARAVVTATGPRTEWGRIGTLMASVRPRRTPLEGRLDLLGRRLVAAALGVGAAIALLRLAHGAPTAESVQLGIALAVAAIPEGLPAVVTIAMALGVRRMARRPVLVRRLPVVESLGSATVICADKTGTLTTGAVTVVRLWLDGREIAVTGAGHTPEGEFLDAARRLDPAAEPALEEALRIGALANRAGLLHRDGRWVAAGDPTEAALLVAARKAGIDRAELVRRWRETGEIPFSAERRLMATFHRLGGRLVVAVKGAPARVIELSDRVLTGSGTEWLTPERRAELLQANQALATRGLRVLALATRDVAAVDRSALRDLVFVGLVGMADPPALMTLALGQIFHLGDARRRRPVLAPARALANRYALAAVAVVVGLQLAALYLPPLAHPLGLEPLDAAA